MDRKTVYFVLLDDFADWEAAFLAPALRTGVMPGREGRYEVKYATPGGRTVHSLGGLTVTPDCDTATLPDDCAALVLVGGMEREETRSRTGRRYGARGAVARSYGRCDLQCRIVPGGARAAQRPAPHERRRVV